MDNNDERIKEIASELTKEKIAEELEEIRQNKDQEGQRDKEEAKQELIYDALRQTDLGNAKGFVHKYCLDLLYCTLWKTWLVWQDTHWKKDDNQIVNGLAKEYVRSLYDLAFVVRDKKLTQHAFRSAARSKIESMLSLARSEPGIPVLPEQFDKNKFLLNLENETYDLQENKLRGHSRSDYITKILPVEYDQKAECPLWLKFLDRIMNQDTSMIVFLQQAIGYALSGDTSEQSIFILYGTGSNGKSTFIETVAALLGDYAVNTPIETLLISRAEGIPNDLARLQGSRFVYAVEAEQNRRFSESLIKREPY